MCLNVTNKHLNDPLEIREAEGDILVYKYFDNWLGGVMKVTPYMNYIWPFSGEASVKEFGVFPLLSDGDTYGYKVRKGLHAYRSQLAGQSFYGFSYRMIIPQGSKYIIGNNGDIVADRMRFETPPNWIYRVGCWISKLIRL